MNAVQAQVCPTALANLDIGVCTLEANRPTSTITFEVDWTGTPTSGELIAVEFLSGMVISTNPVYINPATQTGPVEVTFKVLADGSTGHVLQATSTLNTSCTPVSQTVDFPENTCCSDDNITKLCTDESEVIILTADVGLTDVQWFNEADELVGDGPTLEVDLSIEPFATDLSDGRENYHYTATDLDGCFGELCCPVTVETEICYDLAITKIINTTATPGPFTPGDNVQFTVELTNQGERTAYDIQVTDYIPMGLESVDVLEATANFSGTVGMTITDEGNGVFRVDALESDQTVSVDISFEIEDDFVGESLINSVEISELFKDEDGTRPADDIDSETDNTPDENIEQELANDDQINDIEDGTPQDDDPIEDDFDVAQIEIVQAVALGNFIFLDGDGDGIYDPQDGEDGLDGILIELYRDNGDGLFNPTLDEQILTGADGILGNADDMLSPYLSNGGGFYYFDQLAPGNYFVYIPGSNFEQGSVLNDFVSSLPEDLDDVLDDGDNENGQNGLIAGGVASGLITLTLNGEVENENGQGTYAGLLDDDNVNLTIDFGFTPCPNLVCRDQVNITLDENCEFLVTADVLLNGNPLVDDEWFTIFLADESNQAIPNKTITQAQAGQTIRYGILLEACGEDLCWGEILVEDKTGPVITPPDPVEMLECWLVDDVLNKPASLDPDADEFVGVPTVTDGCDGASVPYTWADNIEYFDCNEEGRYAMITRRFRAVDDQGNAATAIQTITFKTVPIGEFKFEADPDNGFVFEDGQWVLTVQACDAENTEAANIYPVYTDAFGNEVSLDEADCYLSLTDKVVRFDGICGDGYKEQRSYDILDWCQGESVNQFAYLVKVGDFAPPVFDACAFVSGDVVDGNVQTFPADATLSDTKAITDLLNVLDGGNPIDPKGVSPEDDFCVKTISTGPMNCTAAINSSLTALRGLFDTDIVTDVCGDPTITVEVLSYIPELISGFPTGDTVWTVGGYVRQGPMIVGLPVGYHALVISASDDCYNSSLGIIFLEVEDQVKPVMKCDDELRVTLVEGDAKLGIDGYALASYRDVDEGSWDNCSLDSLQVRREISGDARTDWELKNGELAEDADYTPWDDIVEFFCADALDPDNRVKVELQGTDSNGNKSICWLDVHVENGTNYSVDIDKVGDGIISCLEDFDPAKHAVITEAGLGCATIDTELDYIADLNECGDGVYKIFIKNNTVEVGDVQKNASSVSKDTIEVEVRLAHQYWIKFPADVRDYCTVIDDLEGVVVSNDEDVACDLLAIYRDTPERFVTNLGDDDCYKLFQTYKVINWCEYDGESIPVIVSRDWDAPNGYDCDESDPAAGEYNMNPQEPDGDGTPGNSDLYVIVDVNDADQTGIVYYDSDADPKSGTATDDSATDDLVETYWWAVDIAGSCAPTSNPSAWYDEDDDGNFNNTNDPGFDIDGTDSQDDNDNRYGSFGYWQYTQHIIVKDTSAPVVTVGDAIIANDGSLDNLDCDAEVTIPIDIFDACSVADLTVQVIAENGVQFTSRAEASDDNNASVSFPAGNLVEGTYTWTVKVNDGCGNITEEEVEFEVKDVKAPAPICHNGLKVELMPTEASGSAGSTDPSAGMASVWASDFIASDIGDCNGTGDLVPLDDQGNVAPMVARSSYSIYRDEDFTGSTYVSLLEDGEEAFDLVRGLAVTCDDLSADGSAGTVTVRVYAEDAVGNADYCLTYIEVQNNNGACGAPAVGEIAGLVTTESVATVEGVEVQLSGTQSKMYMTNYDGSYGFNNLTAGGDYTILPNKDVEPRNGVSTFDLILIQKHILGVQALDSPYKMIAADVNNSRSISTIDLIQLRKLILNIDETFANNTSWRFVDADYRFRDATNPWLEGFPEVYNINNLDGTVLANFVAVKIGDVNESARSNTIQSLAPRSIQDVVELQTQEVDMKSGNVYTISFSADISEVAGYQFTMEMDPQQVEILDLKQGVAKAENFGVFADQGLITSSYHRSESEEVNGQVLFSLTIRARADVALSEVLGLSSRYTAAEAYSFQDEDLALGLVIGNQSQTNEFALYQNMPNPFQAETMISFKLPELMEGVLELKDISGRTILLKEGDFAKGYNEVRLSADELPGAGVYFYTLHAGKYTATKKMILIK